MNRKYILDYKDFTFSPFKDSRKELGFSGQLLIATDRHTGQKLLVKHTEPSDAPNEFVAGYIAEHLGLPNPKVYLFRPDAHSPFSCKYAVGIEYMEGLQKFEIKELSSLQVTDLIMQTALSSLCFQEDKMQMNMWNSRVISYDYADSFSIENKHIHLCEKKHKHIPVEMFIVLDRFKDHKFFSPNSALKILGWPDAQLNDVKKIYFEGLRPLLDIDDNELFDIMVNVFPENVAGYYNVCLFYMKEYLLSILA